MRINKGIRIKGGRRERMSYGRKREGNESRNFNGIKKREEEQRRITKEECSG